MNMIMSLMRMAAFEDKLHIPVGKFSEFKAHISLGKFIEEISSINTSTN